MKIMLRLMLFVLSLSIAQAGFAQSKTITGRVTSSDDGSAMPGVSVVVKGTTIGSSTDGNGRYSIQAPVGGVLVYSFIGTVSQEKTVGDNNNIDVVLRTDSKALDEVVVTALGIQEEKKSLGYAITEVKGSTVAQTQRENFVNALAGRVAGVEVNSTSGLPGSSTSIVIRGQSSLSGSSQPLFVVDGLPISNDVTSTGTFATAGVSGKSFENRGIDFTNRAADINPEDIESITVLKGPEASALYGIEAASGAIVVTTKRGKAGQGKINYSFNSRISSITKLPERQKVFNRGVNGYTSEGEETLTYFGAPYPEGTQFYDNVSKFFQTAFQQKHNLTFTGGSEKTTYRVSGAYTNSEGYIPNTGLDQINLNSSITTDLNKYISTDVSFDYTRADNDKAFTGVNGAFLHLLLWPMDDDASVYLNPDGTRRDYATFANGVENPFFNVNKNILNTLTDRYRTNVQMSVKPAAGLRFVLQGGVDYYTEKTTIVRHPESNTGKSYGGLFDQVLSTTRNLTVQYYGQYTKRFFGDKFGIDLKAGSMVRDNNRFSAAASGERFQAPGVYSINNTLLTSQRAFNNLNQYRNLGVFGSVGLSYDDIVYLTVTGRNDWSSTLPVENNSFFYPSAAMSFVFTELTPLASIKNILSYGKLRASIAQVGKDARPYSIRPFYENALTTGGGYRYGFTGPSLNLRPEMTTSYEFGTEMKFFNDRFGIDATYFSKTSVDQIVQNLRLSYATGFVLMTFNAGEIKNEGVELQMNATPLQMDNFTWDVSANYTKFWNELVKLPGDVTEFYNSDTWLYGNVRAGSRVGGPLSTFTGYDYFRNKNGELLINPTTGLPTVNTAEWVVVGDKNPDFTVGLTNTFSYKNIGLNFLLDFRVGGDVYNATEHYMVTRGLSPRTLSRDQTRIVEGVLQDGLENTDNPTRNNLPIDVSRNSSYWSSIYNFNTFIEKDINWMRLRDVTLSYRLPSTLLKRAGFVKDLSLSVTGTDLFILTNYSGLDPIGAGTSAATGGAGGGGIDYGNFPTPRGWNFTLRAGF
ncbi:membrane receptor RagA [Rufibacter radiotolerans]|uniref:Membrane receptor RagA n=1 Tax=Rufibacter radiotolerans TaxID=1379910 RepID=A0A0H4W9G0_9BACT|nr:membrane receptor RagA [Rufibacter radiotolerans]